MIDWIKQNLYPPGVEKPNRLALFSAIGEIMTRVRRDADKAFYAHFPYLADDKKLEEHGRALLIPRLQHDTPEEYRNRVAAAGYFLARAGERAYIMGQLEERFGNRFIIIEEFLAIQTKVTDISDDERSWALYLLDSLTDPNVYLELSDWFRYFETVPSCDDASLYTAQRRDSDLFHETIYRNGRITRDGESARSVRIYDGISANLALSQDDIFSCTDDVLGFCALCNPVFQDNFPPNETCAIGMRKYLARNGIHQRGALITRSAGEYIPLEIA